MKIALLTDGLDPYVMGGMQRHSAMLTQYLPKQGVELSVFHTAHNAHAIGKARDWENSLSTSNVKVYPTFVDYPTRGRFPGHYLRDSRAYSRRLLATYLQAGSDHDFIYAKGLTGGAFIESKRAGIQLPPVGINAHGYEMFQRAPSLRVKAEHLLLRSSFKKISQQADYVFSYGAKISHILLERIKVMPEKIIEVPTGIDPSWLTQDKICAVPQTRRFVFVGRYERRKGIEELCQVLGRWKGPPIKFVFIGPVPRSRQLALPWISYRGALSEKFEIQNILDRSDVLVCPSYSEGMPNVIMEAMARRLAIIATDVGATSKICGSENGILIPKITVSSLRYALEEIAVLPEDKLQNMKKRSLNKVASYTWDRVAHSTANVIRRAIDRKG